MNADIISVVTARSALYDAINDVYPLVALASVTNDLDITDNQINTFLTRAILTQSKAVTRYCNNPICIEGRQDVFYNRHFRHEGATRPRDELLQLTRWPLFTVSSVTETTDGITTETLVSGTDYTVNKDNGQLIRLDADATGRPKPWRASQITVAYSAGYGSSVAESHTVPAAPPYTVKVTNAATFGVDLGVTGSAHTYTVSNGTYTFNVADASASVTISYAWNQIPLDIQDAVTRLVLSRYDQRDKDRWLKRESNPGGVDKEWWIPSAASGGNLPPDIREILDAYRVPTI